MIAVEGFIVAITVVAQEISQQECKLVVVATSRLDAPVSTITMNITVAAFLAVGRC